MLDTSLAPDQAPPLSVPMRFFLTAPLFGVLAGLALAWFGPDGLDGRWWPETLALTHLVALGFVTMVMCGALFQMLPVLGGAPVPNARASATAVHLALTIGTIALAVGLESPGIGMLGCAAVALAAAFAVFVAGAARALVAAPRPSASLDGMWLALAGLVVAAALGIGLVLMHLGVVPAYRPLLTDLHAAWGLGGWVLALVAAVAYQFVPMFQITPEYPRVARRWLIAALAVTLVLWSAARILGADDAPAGFAAAGLAVLFAGLTLWLQARRRRRRPGDVALLGWRVAMGSLAVGAALWLALPWWPPRLDGRGETLVGVLVLMGFAATLVVAMLGRIVPFLIWFHLQNRALAAGRELEVPAMAAFLPASAARRQLAVHLVAFGLLVAASLYPAPLARVAGLATALAFGLLAIELARAVRRYRRVEAALETAPASLRTTTAVAERAADPRNVECD